VKILLDTHAFIWWAENNPILSTRARQAIADRTNEVYVSAVVAWEIAIKATLGKIVIFGSVADLVNEQVLLNDFKELPVLLAHTFRLQLLPLLHKDPFDRLLIAQADAEGLAIVTRDPQFPQYGVNLLW